MFAHFSKFAYLCSENQTKGSMEKHDIKLIPHLTNEEYIKNPLGYALMGGSLTIIQQNVYITVLNKMQERINDVLKLQKEKRVSDPQMDMLDQLFSEEERAKEMISFNINLSELGVRTKDYGIVREACEKMANVACTLTYKDDNGELCEEFTHLFSSIILGKRIVGGKEQLNGKMEIKMGVRSAEHAFSLSRGYIQHLRNILSISTNVHTARVYIMLCQLNTPRYNRVATIEYMDFLEKIGIVTYGEHDKKRLHPIWAQQDQKKADGKESAYKTFSVFKRDVLDKVQREMNQLCIDGKMEFSFTVDINRPLDKRTGKMKKQGTPDSLTFTLIDKNDLSLVQEPSEVKPVREAAQPMYYRSSLEDYELLKALASSGNPWAQDCLDGKVPNDTAYVQQLKKLTEG